MRSTIFASALVLCAAPGLGHATTFYFEGTVGLVPAGLQSQFAVGDVLSGQFTFNQNATNYIPSPQDQFSNAYQSNQGQGFTATWTIGGYTVTADGSQIQVTDGFEESPTQFRDTYEWRSGFNRNNGGTSGALNGADVGAFSLELMWISFTQRGLTDPPQIEALSLPSTPPDPLDFDETGFFLSFYDETGTEARLRGVMRIFSEDPIVPVGGAWALGALGLAAAIRFRR